MGVARTEVAFSYRLECGCSENRSYVYLETRVWVYREQKLRLATN